MLDGTGTYENKQNCSTKPTDCLHTKQVWSYWEQNLLKINNFDSKFDMNYMSFRRYQMVILITDIQHLSGKLSRWAGTCINVKKLDSLIQITSRISKVLQSPRHRALFKDDKKITLNVLL